MSPLRIPASLSTSIEAHEKWLKLLEQAQNTAEDDLDLQAKAAKGMFLKERRVPPEVLGRTYAEYCDLINKMYDSYLKSVHLQRAPCMLEIISIFIKRLYELRNELVHLIVNDYIYVDEALISLKKTPFDIEIVVPYHFPLEARPDTMEQLLQIMWSDAIKRKDAPKRKEEPPTQSQGGLFEEDSEPQIARRVMESSVEIIQGTRQLVKLFNNCMKLDNSSEENIMIHKIEEESEHTIIPEEFIKANIIQKQERYRQYYLEDYKAKCKRRKLYFCDNIVEAPMAMRITAAKLIQNIYRKVMARKREAIKEVKRDILLGIIADPFRDHLTLEEENNKIYERKRKLRQKIQEVYLKDLEKEKTRLIVFKKDNQIDDITVQVRAWFREWIYGYGFFPDYPYESEEGTIMVIRGDYPTIAEKVEDDEKFAAANKGKTKEQLKAEKKQAKAEALLKAQTEKEQQQKEAEQIFKLRCNPLSDPGYKIQTSAVTGELIEALQKYRAAWSLYDNFPPDKCADVIYGYMQSLLTEDLMCQLHKDCRKYVDEMMRLDLKLLVKAHQEMYKSIGMRYPKLRARPKPKLPSLPKPLNVDDTLLESLEEVFDLGIISKPTAKLKDILGDLNYAAYDFNLRDPDAKFPSPGFGDVRRRLKLSCIFGSGIEQNATRNNSIMLLGPVRNGKSFLADTVAGELNAVKIDITPEVFSAILDKPLKVLPQVFVAARVFQPAVIYMRNVERVFAKKVLPQDRYLKATQLKTLLPKLIKQILPNDKILFIATCSDPFVAQAKPLASMFTEIILIPRTDYGSLRSVFYYKFQSIRSMPRDYCVQSLAQILRGYGFGVILELYDRVMTAERIVKLNVTPLSPAEFLQPLIDMKVEPTSIEVYQDYVNFFISNSPISEDRAEFETINRYRAVVYQKLAKAKKKS